MLAPPGYAKITSTPSLSMAATRISAPFIVSPRVEAGRIVAGSVAVEVFIKRVGYYKGCGPGDQTLTANAEKRPPVRFKSGYGIL
jgi:hypothetical protein